MYSVDSSSNFLFQEPFQNLAMIFNSWDNRPWNCLHYRNSSLFVALLKRKTLKIFLGIKVFLQQMQQLFMEEWKTTKQFEFKLVHISPVQLSWLLLLKFNVINGWKQEERRVTQPADLSQTSTKFLVISLLRTGATLQFLSIFIYYQHAFSFLEEIYA